MQSRRARGSLLSAVVIAGFACGKTAPSGPSSYIVQYTISTGGPFSYDSLVYDDGTGALVKVIAPALPWSHTRSVAAGGSVEARTWVTASSGAGTAKIRVVWTGGGAAQRDSAIASPSAPGKFSLSIPKRTI